MGSKLDDVPISFHEITSEPVGANGVRSSIRSI